jgi:hypothetical protein
MRAPRTVFSYVPKDRWGNLIFMLESQVPRAVHPLNVSHIVPSDTHHVYLQLKNEDVLSLDSHWWSEILRAWAGVEM